MGFFVVSFSIVLVCCFLKLHGVCISQAGPRVRSVMDLTSYQLMYLIMSGNVLLIMYSDVDQGCSQHPFQVSFLD